MADRTTLWRPRPHWQRSVHAIHLGCSLSPPTDISERMCHYSGDYDDYDDVMADRSIHCC